MGESAPHYVSFVVPVDENGDFFPQYACEAVVAADGEKRRDSHELLHQGRDSFLLRLGKSEVWFSVRPVSKSDRRLPYVGQLKHADFAWLLTEIQPEKPDMLDRLYDEENTFVIGCEPFSHYSGIERLAQSHTG